MAIISTNCSKTKIIMSRFWFGRFFPCTMWLEWGLDHRELKIALEIWWKDSAVIFYNVESDTKKVYYGEFFITVGRYEG